MDYRHDKKGNKGEDSGRKLRFFYSIDWYSERNALRAERKRCPYNLFWYEPMTAFTMQTSEGTDRVFLAYRPLLDRHCQSTNMEFVYIMSTMCVNPIHAVVLYNILSGETEFHLDHEGKLKLMLSSYFHSI